MTAYKLVQVKFKWYGAQAQMQDFILTTYAKLFGRFNRLVSS